MNVPPTGGGPTTDDSTPSPTGRGRSAALDGLRGLALAGMMAWHAQIGWIQGGFARMTIFFVLAGFLAARSYVSIRARHTGRSFTAFWGRRARRLLPVTALGLVFATIVTVAIGSDRAQQALAGDVTSVVANVSNWRFMVDDRSYGAMFENPSAFQHLWSLSVEEQWFLLIPLVLALAAWIASLREAWGRHVVGGAAVVLGLIPLVVAHTPDQAYFGTHVRGGEFLAGVWLALWLRHRDSIGWQPAQQRALAAAGSVSLVLLVAVMLLVDRDHGWLYQGGMALFAIPAALVVAACVTGAPALERALGIAPLRWLGVAALSIYILHWPLFQVVDHVLPDTPYVALVLVQLAVAIGVGSAVHVLIERPLLPSTSVSARPRAFSNRLVLVPAACVMAVLVAVVVVRPAPTPTYDFEAAQQQAIELASADDQASGGASANPDDTNATDSVHLAIFGGSTALVLGLAEGDWVASRPAIAKSDGYARLGCGLLTDGARRSFADTPEPASDDDVGQLRPPEECIDWPSQWADAASSNPVDVALLLFGGWDASLWLLDGDDQWRTIHDDLIATAVEQRLTEGIDLLTEHGTRQVILATTPLIGPGESGRARDERAEADDQDRRTQRFNDVLRTVAADHPAVTLIEYGERIDAIDATESARLLPDGVHPTEDTAREIWDGYLGPLVEQALVH